MKDNPGRRTRARALLFRVEPNQHHTVGTFQQDVIHTTPLTVAFLVSVPVALTAALSWIPPTWPYIMTIASHYIAAFCSVIIAYACFFTVMSHAEEKKKESKEQAAAAAPKPKPKVSDVEFCVSRAQQRREMEEKWGPAGPPFRPIVECRHNAAVHAYLNDSTSRPIDVNEAGGFAYYALQHAAHYNDLNVLLYLIQHGDVSLEQASAHQRTALHVAADFGLVRLAQSLVGNHEANVNVMDANGATPLHLACRQGSIEMVDLLFTDTSTSGDEDDDDDDDDDDDGADINATDNEGQTVLHYAVRGNSVELVTWLANKDNVDDIATLADTPDDGGQTALHHAAAQGRLAMVTCLVETCGADLAATDDDGHSALRLAIDNEHVEIVQYLAKVGDSVALVRITDSAGWTALHAAAALNQVQAAQYVVEFAGTGFLSYFINAKDNAGLTALYHATDQGHINMVRYLVETCQADLYATDSKGGTVLHMAVDTNNVELVEYFLQQDAAAAAADGVDDTTTTSATTITRRSNNLVHVADENGWTALHDAASYNFTSVGPLLVAAGGDRLVNAKDEEGWTALHVACQQVECQDFLLWLLSQDCRPDVRAVTSDGLTALHCACKGGNARMVQTLVLSTVTHTLVPLDLVAPMLNALDENGWTALHHACISRTDALKKTRFLLKAGATVTHVPGGSAPSALHLVSANSSSSSSDQNDDSDNNNSNKDAVHVIRLLLDHFHVDYE